MFPLRRLRPAFLTLLVVAVAVRTPLAQAQTDDYKAVIEAALSEYSSGNWEEALALFRQAHALQPSARTLRGMGVALFEGRHYADALRYLTEAVTETTRPLTEEQHIHVEQLIARARAFVGRLSIVIEPADATVAVDGNSVAGHERREILLDAGEHQLVASAPGYESSVRAVQLLPGTGASLEIELSPKRNASALEVTSTAPPVHAALSAEPPAGPRPSAASDMTSSTRFGRLKYASLGTALAGLALTGVSAWMRDHRARELQQDRCQNYVSDSTTEQGCHRTYEEALSWRRTTIAAGAVSGALVGATFLLFAFDKPIPSHAARLFRACQIQAAPLRVRCTASF